MRVTVSHKKTQAEVVTIVDQAMAQLARQAFPVALKISDFKKSWNGPLMTFSMRASLGVLASPIQGTVLVSDKDITIDCDLPGLFGLLLPDNAVKAEIESRVKGLLT